MNDSSGDLHNFGLSVFSHEGIVFKPRPLLWEWVFLSNKSKVRNILHKELLKGGHASAFNIIPSIKFYDDLKLFKSGRVERYKLESPSIPKLESIDFENIGSLIAIFSWFGISDVHKENILIGKKKGRLVVLPFDIESIFNNYILPAQTHLISSNIQQYSSYGLGSLLNDSFYLNESSSIGIGQILQGYMSTVIVLNNISKIIRDEILKIEFFKNSPIRVILRNTKEYQDAMNIPNLENANFIQEEVEQMKRGDIPYFFRYFFSNDIYYYLDQGLSVKKKVNSNILKESFLETYNDNCFNTGVPECSRPQELLKFGALQLTKSLINIDGSSHRIQYKDINIDSNNELIRLEYKKVGHFVCKKN